MNVVVLRGELVRPAVARVLPSGASVLSFDLAVDDGGRRVAVPVSWPGADEPDRLVPGEAVVVLGRVQRRFFRVGGTTQSRTEVLVDQLVPARARRRVARLLADAGERLEVPPSRRSQPSHVGRTGPQDRRAPM